MDVIRPLKGSPFMLKLASVYVTSHMIIEARFRAPGNRTPLAILESLNHSFKNKRLILFGRNTVAVRKDKWLIYEKKERNGRS